MACARGRMRARGMLLYDAFRAFDSDHNGVLSAEELYGGMTWLGIELTPKQAKELASKMDVDGDGCITFADFRRVLSDPSHCISQRSNAGLDGDELDDDMQRDLWDLKSSTPSWSDPDHVDQMDEKWTGVRPRSLRTDDEKQLIHTAIVGELSDRVRASASALSVSLRKVGGFARIWDSEATGARYQCTVWCPKLPAPTNHRIHICLGHYISREFGLPKDAIERYYLSLTDTTSWRLFKSKFLEKDILDVLIPHPIRYTEVWRHRRGERPLYVWRPVPPTPDFVALGMFATPSDDPPQVNECRCVPKVWLIPTTEIPRRVWTDAGGGGRPGSFWVLSKTGLLHATEQHSPPSEVGYDFWSMEFMANYRIGEINLKWNTEGGGSGKGCVVAPPPRRRAPKGGLSEDMNEMSQMMEKEKVEFCRQRELVLGHTKKQPKKATGTHKNDEEMKVYIFDMFENMSVELPKALEDSLYG
jgi:hypothetical protein